MTNGDSCFWGAAIFEGWEVETPQDTMKDLFPQFKIPCAFTFFKEQFFFQKLAPKKSGEKPLVPKTF